MESPAAPNEPQLIRAAQHGNMAAFKTLVEIHHGRVRAFLAVRMSNAVVTEQTLTDNGTVQTVKASAPAWGKQCLGRLRVTK